MTIRSVGYALSWEYWRRGMFWFVPSTLAPTIMCLLLLTVRRVPSSSFWLDVGAHLRPALVPFVLLMPLLVAMASWLALRRHYTLPVPTRWVVVWSLANGALAAAGTYCCTALAFNGVLHADWPLAVPALCSTTASVAFQAGLWWLGPSRGLLGVLAAAGCASLAAAGRLSAGPSPLVERVELPQEWSQLTAIGVAIWLSVVAVSYLVAVNGVARDRRGEAWSLSWLSRWWAAATGALSRLTRGRRGAAAFRSVSSAQFWFEWRTKGRLVPLVTAGMLGGLWLCFGFSGIEPYEVSIVLRGFTFLFVLASPLIGVFLGSRVNGFDLTSFTATRPLPDGGLAAAVLRSAVAGVGSAAVLWLVGSIAALAIWVPEDWRAVRSLWFVAVFEKFGWGATLFGLACWTFVGLGASLALCRRWLVCWGGLAFGGVLLSYGYILDRLPPALAEALIVLVAAACFGCTVAAFIAARRRRLLSGRAVLAYLAGYLILLVPPLSRSSPWRSSDGSVHPGPATY